MASCKYTKSLISTLTAIVTMEGLLMPPFTTGSGPPSRDGFQGFCIQVSDCGVVRVIICRLMETRHECTWCGCPE